MSDQWRGIDKTNVIPTGGIGINGNHVLDHLFPIRIRQYSVIQLINSYWCSSVVGRQNELLFCFPRL